MINSFLYIDINISFLIDITIFFFLRFSSFLLLHFRHFFFFFSSSITTIISSSQPACCRAGALRGMLRQAYMRTGAKSARASGHARGSALLRSAQRAARAAAATARFVWCRYACGACSDERCDARKYVTRELLFIFFSLLILLFAVIAAAFIYLLPHFAFISFFRRHFFAFFHFSLSLFATFITIISPLFFMFHFAFAVIAFFHYIIISFNWWLLLHYFFSLFFFSFFSITLSCFRYCFVFFDTVYYTLSLIAISAFSWPHNNRYLPSQYFIIINRLILPQYNNTDTHILPHYAFFITTILLSLRHTSLVIFIITHCHIAAVARYASRIVYCIIIILLLRHYCHFLSLFSQLYIFADYLPCHYVIWLPLSFRHFIIVSSSFSDFRLRFIFFDID